MSEHDPIAHLDFNFSPEITASGGMERFESLEDSRIRILTTFFDHVHALDAAYGQIDPDDVNQYVDRLCRLQDLMAGEMDAFELHAGDIIQARVPNLVYPTGFMAEFDAGESVRAQFDSLMIYQHYDIAADGRQAKRFPFGLNLSVTQPMTVSSHGILPFEGMGDVHPLISLHHDAADLQRVILPLK
ncbi:MAG: hypothetical protein ABIR91_05720 [Candidatus Saccharimonadales bacterium]